MATSQVSKDVSAFIRQWLRDTGTPQFEAAKWSGISPTKLSTRLSGLIEWTIAELTSFSEEVLGMPLSSLLIQVKYATSDRKVDE